MYSRCFFNLRCDNRFQHAFTAWSCVFKVITLVSANQVYYFVNACWKRLSQLRFSAVLVETYQTSPKTKFYIFYNRSIKSVESLYKSIPLRWYIFLAKRIQIQWGPGIRTSTVTRIPLSVLKKVRISESTSVSVLRIVELSKYSNSLLVLTKKSSN